MLKTKDILLLIFINALSISLVLVSRWTNGIIIFDHLYRLIAGGVSYIVGAVIYALAKREYVHAVFHVFVLLGLANHIVSEYLIP